MQEKGIISTKESLILPICSSNKHDLELTQTPFVNISILIEGFTSSFFKIIIYKTFNRRRNFWNTEAIWKRYVPILFQHVKGNPICEEKLAPTVATQSIERLVEAIAPNKFQCNKATEENYIPYPTEWWKAHSYIKPRHQNTRYVAALVCKNRTWKPREVIQVPSCVYILPVRRANLMAMFREPTAKYSSFQVSPIKNLANDDKGMTEREKMLYIKT